MIKKEQCKKNTRKPAKTLMISIRLDKQTSEWMKKEDLSPTAIFNEACKELGYNG